MAELQRRLERLTGGSLGPTAAPAPTPNGPASLLPPAGSVLQMEGQDRLRTELRIRADPLPHPGGLIASHLDKVLIGHCLS